jgi:hypothetical protein
MYIPPTVARQKRYGGNEYTRNNRRIVGRVVFYAVRVESKEINSSQNLFYKSDVILSAEECGQVHSLTLTLQVWSVW